MQQQEPMRQAAPAVQRTVYWASHWFRFWRLYYGIFFTVIFLGIGAIFFAIDIAIGAVVFLIMLLLAALMIFMGLGNTRMRLELTPEGLYFHHAFGSFYYVPWQLLHREAPLPFLSDMLQRPGLYLATPAREDLSIEQGIQMRLPIVKHTFGSKIINMMNFKKLVSNEYLAVGAVFVNWLQSPARQHVFQCAPQLAAPPVPPMMPAQQYYPQQGQPMHGQVMYGTQQPPAYPQQPMQPSPTYYPQQGQPPMGNPPQPQQ